MRWPFVSRRRFEAELAAVKADRERIRSERNQFLNDRNAARAAARTAARQYKDLDEQHTAVSLVNARLTDDLKTAREDLTAARADASVSLAGQLRAELKREKKRADRLQKELDDATFLPAGGVVDSRKWQPGYVEPKADRT